LATLSNPNFRGAVNYFKRSAVLMRLGPWLFLVLAARLCVNPGTAAEIVTADGVPRSQNAPLFSGSSSLGDPMDAAAKARSWRLVRSAGQNGEPGEPAILHTADFERSDPRLAGLMLRCGKQGIEPIIVVIEPYPPHARPEITLRTPGQETRFAGTIIPTGAGIRLPSDATILLTSASHTAREAEIKVAEGDAVIAGIVALSGLSEALKSLKAECVQK
jgi:hypothetical protein